MCPKVTVSYTHIVNCSLCTKTQVYTANGAYTVNKKKPGEVHTTPVHGNRDSGSAIAVSHTHILTCRPFMKTQFYTAKAYTVEILKKLTTHNTSAR